MNIEKQKYTVYLDFDGTVTTFNFPNLGGYNPNCKEVIQNLIKAGHTIFLNTYRADLQEGGFNQNNLNEAISFLKSLDSSFDFKVMKNKKDPAIWHWDRHIEEKTIFIDDAAEKMPLRLETNKKSISVDWFEVDKQFRQYGLY